MSESVELLKIEGLCKNFGGLRAVKDFEMAIPTGGLFGLIGPNGAGKTTILNTISGLLSPSSGDIVFLNESIAKLRPEQVVRKGVVQVPGVVLEDGAHRILDQHLAETLIA